MKDCDQQVLEQVVWTVNFSFSKRKKKKKDRKKEEREEKRNKYRSGKVWRIVQEGEESSAKVGRSSTACWSGKRKSWRGGSSVNGRIGDDGARGKGLKSLDISGKYALRRGEVKYTDTSPSGSGKVVASLDYRDEIERCNPPWRWRDGELDYTITRGKRWKRRRERETVFRPD